MGMIKEFKEFIHKGNVLDLAVAVILATYFGVIIKSLTDHIIMPVVGLMLGGVDFSKLKYVLKEGHAAVMNGDTVVAEAVPEVAISYGLFINAIITFIIVAFCVFLIVKAYNASQRKKEEAPKDPETPQLSMQEKLLVEIRDELRNKS